MKRVDFSQHYQKSKINDTIFRWVDRVKTNLLKKKYDDKGFKILDIGCGTAAITSKIKGCQIYGVDVNDSLLNIAKENKIITRKGSFENIPFEDNFFDAVVSIDSIEHVHSRHVTLLELKRVLKKEGEFVVFTPAYDSLTWLLGEKLVNIITKKPSDHISPFTKESLNYLLAIHFNKVSKIKIINFGLGLYAYANNKK